MSYVLQENPASHSPPELSAWEAQVALWRALGGPSHVPENEELEGLARWLSRDEADETMEMLLGRALAVRAMAAEVPRKSLPGLLRWYVSGSSSELSLLARERIQHVAHRELNALLEEEQQALLLREAKYQRAAAAIEAMPAPSQEDAGLLVEGGRSSALVSGPDQSNTSIEDEHNALASLREASDRLKNHGYLVIVVSPEDLQREDASLSEIRARTILSWATDQFGTSLIDGDAVSHLRRLLRQAFRWEMATRR